MTKSIPFSVALPKEPATLNPITTKEFNEVMASTIQVKVDYDLKRRLDILFKELGTDTTSAIRMFLTQAVANNGFPFEIRKNSRVEYCPYEMMTEEEMLKKLKRSRGHCQDGRCREGDKVVSDLRGKYGL